MSHPETWKRRAGALVLSVLLGGCSTTGDVGGADTGLPNAHAGPFRALEQSEVAGVRLAPNVIEDEDRRLVDLSVVDADADPSTLPVVGYALAAAEGVVVRMTAEDGRSFSLDAPTVLSASLPWELGRIDAVSAVRASHGVQAGKFVVYYEAGGAIGRAISDDGVAFAKDPQPVATAASFGLIGRLGSPTVTPLVEGGWAMFFELRDGQTVSVYEARSTHGVVWTLAQLGPVLEAGLTADDVGAIADPEAVSVRSALGRPITWLYYAATNAEGKRVIAVAARRPGQAFEPAVSAVFGSDEPLMPRAPSVVRFDSFSLLFVTQRAGSTESRQYEAVAVAVAPADRRLTIAPTP